MFNIGSVSPSYNDYISATIRFLINKFIVNKKFIQIKAFISIIPKTLRKVGLYLVAIEI